MHIVVFSPYCDGGKSENGSKLIRLVLWYITNAPSLGAVSRVRDMCFNLNKFIELQALWFVIYSFIKREFRQKRIRISRKVFMRELFTIKMF